MQQSIVEKMEAMVRGDVDVPQSEAISMAKSMKREVRRLKTIYRVVSGMNL